MILKIEDGILLKPYVLPWHDEGYKAPPQAWTPADIDAIQKLADKVLVESMKATGEMPSTLDGQQARLEAWHTFEDFHNARREPWQGWVPIVFQHDRKIGLAYRKLFVQLNEGRQPTKFEKGARFPPDGFYRFRNNKIEAASDEANATAD